jgi:hypothetical protein
MRPDGRIPLLGERGREATLHIRTRLWLVPAAVGLVALLGLAAPAQASLAGGWCGTEASTDDTAHAVLPGQVVKVVYARPSDLPNGFARYADLIQESMRGLVERFRRETNGAKVLALDVGTSCGPQFVDIQSVVLPQTAGAYRALALDAKRDALFADVRTVLGLGAFPGPGGVSNRDYVVFADSVMDDGWSVGVAESIVDDRPGSVNLSNGGNQVALVWGTGATEFIALRSSPQGTSGWLQRETLHELTHAFGAVNFSAPHHDGSAHVNDDPLDVMWSGAGRVNPSNEQLIGGPYDSGHDDYFNPGAPAGSYLATHWNIFDAVFLCPPAACDVPGNPPVARLRMGPVSSTGNSVVVDASATTSSAPIASVRFDLDYDGTFETDTGTSLVTRAPLPTQAVAVKVTDRNGLPDIARAAFKPGQGAQSGSGGARRSGRASLRLLGRTILINLKTGRGKLRARCNNITADRCRVDLALKVKRSGERRRIKAGRARGTVPGARTRVLPVKLGRRGLGLLRHSRSKALRARFVGSSRNRLGRPVQVTKRVTLRGKRGGKRRRRG